MPKTRSASANDGANPQQAKRPRYTDPTESEIEKEFLLSDSESEQEAAEESVDDTVATPTAEEWMLHVNTAKPFILKQFVSHKHLAVESVLKQWRFLKGTVWESDGDICAAAVNKGLPLDELQGNPIITKAEDWGKVLRNAKSKKQLVELWKTTPGRMQRKMVVAYSALDRGIAYTSIPAELQGYDIVNDALRNGMCRWRVVPHEYRQDGETALCAREGGVSSFDDVVRDVTTDKEKLWREWPCKEPSTTRFWNAAPASILSDRGLMLETIGRVGGEVAMKHIRGGLKEDRDFISSAVERNPVALASVPEETCWRFSSLFSLERVTKYFEHGGNDSRDLSQRVPKESWNDRNFLKGWIHAGGDITVAMVRVCQDDKEIILLHAKHYFKKSGDTRYSETATAAISEDLQRDKSFVQDLLHHAPASAVIYMIENSELFHDYETLLLAFAKWPEFCHDDNGKFILHDRWYYRLRQRPIFPKMKKQLREHECFFKGILCGMFCPDSSLTVLDQGSDATIKKTIASFLNFPQGSALTWLFEAGINLNVKGYNPLRASAALK